MTSKEALEIIREHICKESNHFHEYINSSEDLSRAWYILENFTSREEPKFVKKDNDYDMYYCPNCGAWITPGDYCPTCGQCLDWGTELEGKTRKIVLKRGRKK